MSTNSTATFGEDADDRHERVFQEAQGHSLAQDAQHVDVVIEQLTFVLEPCGGAKSRYEAVIDASSDWGVVHRSAQGACTSDVVDETFEQVAFVP